MIEWDITHEKHSEQFLVESKGLIKYVILIFVLYLLSFQKSFTPLKTHDIKNHWSFL